LGRWVQPGVHRPRSNWQGQETLSQPHPLIVANRFKRRRPYSNALLSPRPAGPQSSSHPRRKRQEQRCGPTRSADSSILASRHLQRSRRSSILIRVRMACIVASRAWPYRTILRSAGCRCGGLMLGPSQFAVYRALEVQRQVVNLATSARVVAVKSMVEMTRRPGRPASPPRGSLPISEN
jgi:hypothetical protein